MRLAKPTLDPLLSTLRTLPFVERVEVSAGAARKGAGEWDAGLLLATPLGRKRLLVAWKAAPLSGAMQERILSLAARVPTEDWILFCHHVPAEVGQRLAQARVNYVDSAGNCHFALGRHYLAHIEGRRAQPVAATRGGLSATAVQVLLALLSKPDLIDLNVRQFGERTGLSKSSVAYAFQRLITQGLVLETRSGRRLVPGAVLDRWVVGYSEILRPPLVLGQYDAVERDPRALEKRLDASLSSAGVAWWWTGGAAAHRLTGHYRGEQTALHVDGFLPDLPRKLQLVPRSGGPITLLRSPGPILQEAAPQPHVAPVPLVYAELLAQGNERAREAAEELRERFLPDWR